MWPTARLFQALAENQGEAVVVAVPYPGASPDNVERVAVYHHDLERLGDERRQDIVGRRRAHEDFVAGLIAEAQAEGDVDADENARVLTRLVFGTMILTYDWFRPGRDDPEQVADACAEFAIRGVTGGGD